MTPRIRRLCAALPFLAAALAVCPSPAIAQQAYTYPLRLSPDGRRLTDQTGRPFLMSGDAAWSLIVQLDLAQAAQYLDDRRSKGFNLVLVNLIEHAFADHPPLNHNGAAPFSTPGNFSTPNAAYFDHAEAVVQLAEARGMVVLLAPAYLGYNGGTEGWYQEMAANGTGVLRQYGRYVGARFASHTNVVWLLGGDYDPPQRELVEAVADGIRDMDGQHLLTAHCAPESSALDVYGGLSWLALNDTYSYDAALYVPNLADFNRPDFKPFFMIESRYENEGDGTRSRVRRQAWWSVTSGAGGHIFGNRPIWLFGSGWQQALGSPGAQDMAHLPSLLERHSWSALLPDQAHQLVTAGYGTFGSTDYITGGRTADGLLAMIYVPPTGTATRTFTVNMASMAAPAIARWYNPTTGAFRAPVGRAFRNSGMRMFTTPGNNGNRTNDWVLVLKAPPSASW